MPKMDNTIRGLPVRYQFMNLETKSEAAGRRSIPENYVIIPSCYHMNKPILLIDDDRSLRRALRLYLESSGFTCKEADDGREALVLLDGGLDVDLIISDYHMPVINGLNFLKALSYRVNGQNVRVILLSGNMTREMKQEAKQAGAFEVLAKPYDHQELLAVVSRACTQ
jgi:two-component system, chemotaxis family, chemotaxis protein CheY